MKLDTGLGAAFELGTTIIKRLFPDKQQQEQGQQELAKMAVNGELQTIANRFSVIIAEAQSENRLTSGWRPIVMLTFTALIVAKWLGFTSPGVTEAIELELLAIIKVGLGGYVIGRSAEKGIKEWKKRTE